ncbi:helix-turn-helix domain-containing protein [Paenibacillus pinistramenti]|uniref:helix-turn-helix domain-containing protein n=1 Tax=Paenibacillus pinistramenti TaxID=1768003 RepID=UPI001108F276|nr:helix-turn-helix domain-containing protein [Paenibacillus pinistramenti]
MKALIVDDEKHVRDAIRLLVPWQNWEIGTILEAADGQSAIDLIEKERPELIFTDMMMPVRSGVDLLRWMYDHGVTGKTIVISGYDDFELARSTLRYGGLDYILKPIEPEMLTQAVDAAVTQWKREEDSRQSAVQRGVELNRLKPVYLDKVFSQLIEGAESYRAVAADLETETGLPQGSRLIRLALLSLEGLHPVNLRSFSSNEDLFYFAVMNICNEILGRNKTGYAFSYWNQRREIVMVIWNSLDQAEALMRHIQESCMRTLRTSFHIGLGQSHDFPAELAKAYEEAKNTLQRRNLLESGVWIHPAAPVSAKESGSLSLLHLSEYDEKLRHAVFSGQPALIRGAVQEWVQAAADTGKLTPEQLRIWRSEYRMMCSQWAKEWLGDDAVPPQVQLDSEAFQVRTEPDGIFSLANWQDRLAGELTEFSKHLHELKQESGSIIFQIKKYVEAHHREDLSLQDIASQFFLSREYISRKFKQELGENLSDYIARIRVERAQKLLVNPNLRMVQIAEMVGYQDEKYFSKVFKKITGLTPNEYRKSLQGELN